LKQLKQKTEQSGRIPPVYPRMGRILQNLKIKLVLYSILFTKGICTFFRIYG